MKRIIVPNIKMIDHELKCQGRNGQWGILFKKQGCLDGACATYSVIMDLLIIRAINEKDTHISVEHKSPTTKKLFKVFCNDYGMHRDGQTFFKIKRMLLESFGSEVDVCHNVIAGYDSIAKISETIKSGIPVVISVSNANANMSHAMVAIGVEVEDDNVSKIFCLDPGGNYIQGRRRWNAEIDVKNGKQKYFSYYSDYRGVRDKWKIQLDDILIIERKTY